MPYRRTTFSKFIIQSLRRRAGADPDLAALLNDVMTATKLIAATVARGAADGQTADAMAGEILRATCDYGGQVCGVFSATMAQPADVPPGTPRGRYLLAYAPLDGVDDMDVNQPVGTIFSILRAPDDAGAPDAAAFRQPGTAQVAAGYALYGPSALLVIALGDGVHGFRLDRELGAYMLAHPDIRIPDAMGGVAVNAAQARYWEAPVRRYVEECAEGRDGPRGDDVATRWGDSAVAEVHRILMRGGVYLDPRDMRDAARPGGAHLLTAANPLAMIMEQAGGAASTGRARILDVVPASLDQRVPLILGQRREVARIADYHAAHDRGEPVRFDSPLFKTRSLFRS